MKNILVTGYTGQLGYDVVVELNKRGYNSITPSREDMDLLDEDKIEYYIINSKCDAIIHCGAYTEVDNAQDNEKLCMKVNAKATKHICLCAKELDIPVIYISTDYVFDGTKSTPYTEEDIPSPINIYGVSKYIGEQYVADILDKYYIVRVSWIFGINGKNFIDTMLKLSETKADIKVVNDQIGSPTYSLDLARLLVDMLETNKYGIYNATNEGTCSWYDFAKAIFEITNKKIVVDPISSSEYKTKAKRPLNSVLNKNKLTKAGFNSLQHWKDALVEYLRQKGEY